MRFWVKVLLEGSFLKCVDVLFEVSSGKSWGWAAPGLLGLGWNFYLARVPAWGVVCAAVGTPPEENQPFNDGSGGTQGFGRPPPQKATATGDITLGSGQTTSEHIAFTLTDVRNYMQTPIVYGNFLYGCRNNGVMSCSDARTGKHHYQQRLDSGVGFTASPVAGEGKIYFTSEEGEVHVLKVGREFERLAENSMNDICMATPAISEGTLFFRTKSHLVAIGDQPIAGPDVEAKKKP